MSFVQRIECDAKFLRRGARLVVGETFTCGALPEFDLDFLVVIPGAAHGAGAALRITLERFRGLRWAGRGKDEAEAQGAQVEMEVIFVLEERRDFVLVALGNEFWFWKSLFEIFDNVVTLDVNGAVMDQHWDQPARIDAQKPRREIIVAVQIDVVRLPGNALEVEKDAKLLRT
jgi:hypothetical protein